MAENNNLSLYNRLRNVPGDAQKKITAGRLKGMTNINPMWRIKALTEQFGPCGIGWKYVVMRQWTETGANNEVIACCNIDLYIKYNGEWSEAIPGTGGSTLIAKETNGLHTSDECFKMALTDAISVAAKALGAGADIYWQEDRTKYDALNGNEQNEPPKQRDYNKNAASAGAMVKEQEITPPQGGPVSVTPSGPSSSKISERQMETLYALSEAAGVDRERLRNDIIKKFRVIDPRDMTQEQFDKKYHDINEYLKRQHSKGGQGNA